MFLIQIYIKKVNLPWIAFLLDYMQDVFLQERALFVNLTGSSCRWIKLTKLNIFDIHFAAERSRDTVQNGESIVEKLGGLELWKIEGNNSFETIS